MWLKDIIPERVKQYDCITEEQKQNESALDIVL